MLHIKVLKALNWRENGEKNALVFLFKSKIHHFKQMCLQEDKCEKLSMGMLSLPCTKMRAVRIGWNVYCTNKFKFVYFAHKIFIVQWA